MTVLSLTYQLSSWEENPGPLKGTTTPKVHAKQLWCTLGVVVLPELSIWLSLEVFLGKGEKSVLGLVATQRPSAFSLLCSRHYIPI